jgi:putative 4-mercaptohistidine N1-methyltranferase
MNPYETDKLLREYLLFHYGRPEEILPWPNGPREALGYAERCVTECVDASALPAAARALDIGCAVGRSTFELARVCGEVIGIDQSARFIEAAQHLAKTGRLEYFHAEEGLIERASVAEIPAEIDRQRVRFMHGDALALPSDLGVFDVVLAANLIDRLAKPRLFLAQLGRLVASGGQLILTSPYTWLLDYTSIDEWIGGTVAADKEQQTLDGLVTALQNDFVLTATKELPFLIREHARKFQWSVAQATIWRRR